MHRRNLVLLCFFLTLSSLLQLASGRLPPRQLGRISSILQTLGERVTTNTNRIYHRNCATINEIRELVRGVGICGNKVQGDIISRFTRQTNDLWHFIYALIEQADWEADQLIVQTGITFETKLQLITDQATVQADLADFHRLLGKGQKIEQPIVADVCLRYVGVVKEFGEFTEKLHLQALYDKSCSADSEHQQLFEKEFEQVAVKLTDLLDYYSSHTALATKVTVEEMVGIVGRLLQKEIAAVRELLT